VIGAPIGAYTLTVGTGIPSLAGEGEPVDAVGRLTRFVEALGPLFAVQTKRNHGRSTPPTAKEARR
jgi:hypothetical protein